MAPKNKLKRSKPAPQSEAMKSIFLSIKSINNEINNAIWFKCVLEEGNNIVISNYKDVCFDGANCYNIIKNSIQNSFILSLSKLFETPRPRKGKSKVEALNRSDLASIPVLIHFLRQERCRSRLINRASGGWQDQPAPLSKERESHCLSALNHCTEVWNSLRSGGGLRPAHNLARFRNDHVAHLYKEERAWNANRYRELFLLLDVAMDIATHASLAINGHNVGFSEKQTAWSREARAFWEPALGAAIGFREK